MKILLNMQDDGLSALIWLEMARQYLKAGRTVVAITDDKNPDELIGVGDGLPSYAEGLSGHPRFFSCEVSPEDADLFLGDLQSLSADTVLMFNMDLFCQAERTKAWQTVLDYCAEMPNEMVFDIAALPPFPPTEQYQNVRAFPWGYVAGHRLVSAATKRTIGALCPTLANAVEVPFSSPMAGWPGVGVWHVVNSSGTYEVCVPFERLEDNISAYAPLWDVRYPHVTITLDDSGDST